MKNFLPYNCFLKKIKIYNALKSDRNISDSAEVDFGPAKVGEKSRYGDSGLTVRMNNQKPESIEFFIGLDKDMQGTEAEYCYYFIQTHGLINQAGFVSFTRGAASLNILRRVLSPGVNHITFFNQSGRPVAEKFVFTPQAKKELIVRGIEEKGIRKPVNIEIESAGEQPGKSIPDLSIAVTNTSRSLYFPDINDYLVLGSEFGIPAGRKGLFNGNEIDAIEIEKLLDGARSYWIDWERILAGKFSESLYRQEKSEHLLEGKLTDKETGQPARDEYVFLATPGKNAVFQYSLSNADGHFSFRLPGAGVVSDIVIQPEKTDKNYSIEIISPFTREYPLRWSHSNVLSGDIPSFIKNWAANYQVNRIYGIASVSEPLKAISALPSTARFYGRPDIEIKLDDYIKLPLMEEVFYELIPGVPLRRRRGEFELSIIDPPEFRTLGRPPAMMIDGIIIKDAALIANLDPEYVERIDVVKERYFVGDYLFFGIINVTTRAGDLSNITLPDYAVRLRYSPIDPVFRFKAPLYQSEEALRSRVPDFRNTLYWNPSVGSPESSTLKAVFNTSDYCGEYNISIQGFDADGSPVSSTRSFSVSR
jgi:hypothetical protein